MRKEANKQHYRKENDAEPRAYAPERVDSAWIGGCSRTAEPVAHCLLQLNCLPEAFHIWKLRK